MPVPSLLDIFTKDTAEDRAAQLVELISSAVTPDAWRDRGGSLGAMTYFAGTLTVTHTESAHREIAALLDRLHAQTARTRAAIARQSLPPELEPVAKALAEQGFHAPQLLAPIFVYTRSGEQFRAEGIAPQTGRALQIDVGGRATLEGAEQVSIELKAGLREAPPLVGVAGLPQRPPLFELLSSVTTRLGDHVVLATAPGATGAEQAVAVVVRVTKAP